MSTIPEDVNTVSANTRRFIGVFALMILPLLTSSLSAEIYKETQADGSVIYTDQPSDKVSQEKIDLKPLTTIPAIDPDSVDIAPPEKKEKIDYNISINSPAHERTFQNQEADAIPLLVGIMPNTVRLEEIQITLDGNTIPPQTTVLPYLYRGEHTISVKIIKSGRTVAEESTTFFVHRHAGG